MADASSSDTTSDCCNECFSDITSEKSEYVVVGRKPCPSHRRSKRNFLQKLMIREKHCQNGVQWLVHIVMGLTQCGQFLLTYTYTLDVSSNTSLYKYLLHWWAITPNRVARKVAEVTLFGNYTIYRELSIVISQWPMERNKLVIHGLCSTNFLHLQPTDRAYLTITTVPSLYNCKDCLKIAASYEEEGEELAANWDGCVRCNCLQHGLTVHTTYEVISPYPKFRATVCLNYWNHVVVNTGNFLHVLRVDLNIPRSKNQRTCDKQDSSVHEPGAMVPDTIPLDMSDVEETDYSSRTEEGQKYESSDEKVGTPECVDRSPKCESSLEQDFLDEPVKLGRDLPLTTSSSNQSDCVCDISSKPDVALSIKLCDCSSTAECTRCGRGSGGSDSPVSRAGGVEQTAISVRDKILQDFCEDTSQELNIGSDLITLVKHPSCSPRSTPQRLPADLRTITTWSSPILTPPSDILRTRNSESSHRVQIPQRSTNSSSSQQRSSSPQPGASQQDANSVASISSPLQSVSISSASSSRSSRLMSPPIARSFRHPSPRKRSSLHSPPPVVNASQSARTTRATHKLILEAEKAYEFTDEAQETTCEKLSSFRKRRLADKKYEFCDEAEDAENIIPFKHIRDQFKHRGACSIHQIPSSPAMSPVLPNGRRHWVDSDQSESDELNLAQDISIATDLTNPETDEETGGYVSYQCVLPMLVHGSGYVQMQMISNSKAEKLVLSTLKLKKIRIRITDSYKDK
ncbi:hypothetical protein DMN91_012199 [Ooceraea biroi]|uniref:DDB1- and CUL4-associated factor 15 WD40 repeat-containing domain-containing protein n=1 Tax=Ooceraea biroi TaxID=2015173 RepID=A0A3L8D418_OOCBI|nr:hypothetical protein DMN91_012199 [Ooceraea biroi]